MEFPKTKAAKGRDAYYSKKTKLREPGRTFCSAIQTCKSATYNDAEDESRIYAPGLGAVQEEVLKQCGLIDPALCRRKYTVTTTKS